jgi:predicted HTH domain antitoxin
VRYMPVAKLALSAGRTSPGIDLFSFQGALKERNIPRNYSLRDLHDDMEALKKLFPK